MFREMRRKRQELSREEAEGILREGTSGVLAVEGDGGYPYAVPLSYAWDGGKLLFHCARSGHKLDAVKRNPKASFCVIGQDRVIPDEYTTAYRSVIAFGRIRVIGDDGERRAAVERLALKYHPGDTWENRNRYIDKEWAPLCMLEMTVEHLSGKEAIELVRQRDSGTSP